MQLKGIKRKVQKEETGLKGCGCVLFVGSARCYHTMDWFRSAKRILNPRGVLLATDSIESESFVRIATAGDDIASLVNVDRLLLSGQNRFGNIWRNIIKSLLLPLQAILLRRIVAGSTPIMVHAHAMYYMWLCWAARVRYIGTPQGSEILIRPQKSNIYRFFARRSLKAAARVTVDSVVMQKAIKELAGVESFIVQNGIDIGKIGRIANNPPRTKAVLSIRGITPLYRIHKIFEARAASSLRPDITLVFPFWEEGYRDSLSGFMTDRDLNLGRVSRVELYQVMLQSKLAVSIPKSDSSPRSVYEAIFCGCCVAATWAPWMNDLPECMRSRVIIVNLEDLRWLDLALEKASEIVAEPYVASHRARMMFDQVESMRFMAARVYGLGDHEDKMVIFQKSIGSESSA